MLELEISAPAGDDVKADPESALRRIAVTFDSFAEFAQRTAPHLSASRIFLETTERLPPRTAVRLEVALRQGATLVRALGQTAPPPDPGADGPGAEEPPGIEVRFTYVDPASAQVIDSLSRRAGGSQLATAARAPGVAAAAFVAPGAVVAPEAEAPEPAPADQPAPSLEEVAAEPAEESWELEVDSLLSEVLPDAGAPTPATGLPPPRAAVTAAETAATLAADGLPAGSDGWVQDFVPQPAPPAAAEELAGAPLGDLPLRAAEPGDEEEAEPLLPAIDLPDAPGPPPQVRVEGAAEDEALVLGFGESITMAPPRRRSIYRPLLLLLAGVAALGAFFYFRGAGFGLPALGFGSAPEPAAAVVAQKPPAAPPEPGPGEPETPSGEAPSGLTPAVAAPPPAVVEPPPVVAAPPPPAAAAPPAVTPTPPPASPSPAAVPAPAATTEAVEAVVRAWAAAWSAQRVDDYLASYAPQYHPPGLSRRDWEEQRRVRITAPAQIAVEASNFSVEVLGPDRARARFLQLYTTETRNLRAWKVMELERRPEGWKIVDEQVDRR